MPRAGLLAFSAPLARALLGKRVGEVALLQTPRSSEELEVLEIGYGAGDRLASLAFDPLRPRRQPCTMRPCPW